MEVLATNPQANRRHTSILAFNLQSKCYTRTQAQRKCAGMRVAIGSVGRSPRKFRDDALPAPHSLAWLHMRLGLERQEHIGA